MVHGDFSNISNAANIYIEKKKRETLEMLH